MEPKAYSCLWPLWVQRVLERRLKGPYRLDCMNQVTVAGSRFGESLKFIL